MGESNIRGIMDTTMDKIRAMVDADTVIGNPITMEGVTLIPVSKVSFGLATGGSDLPVKNVSKETFAGGGGAGVSITPIAFIAVSGGNVKMLQIYKDNNTIDKAISMIPDLFDRVKNLFDSSKADPQLPEV